MGAWITSEWRWLLEVLNPPVITVIGSVPGRLTYYGICHLFETVYFLFCWYLDINIFRVMAAFIIQTERLLRMKERVISIYPGNIEQNWGSPHRTGMYGHTKYLHSGLSGGWYENSPTSLHKYGNHTTG